MSGVKLGERQPRKGAMEAIRKHIGPLKRAQEIGAETTVWRRRI